MLLIPKLLWICLFLFLKKDELSVIQEKTVMALD